MTTTEFIFDTPLYQKVAEGFEQILKDLSTSYAPYRDSAQFDGYNPYQAKESTFVVDERLEFRADMNNRNTNFHTSETDGICSCVLKCRRYGDIIGLYVLVNSADKWIMKIGQFPSVADIHIGRIQQYRSVLSKEDLKEFTRAIGLAANGVGIGSYVYMRRIFEKLIYSAAKKAIEDGGVVVDEFRKMRMNEKIDALKAYLPATLVELKDMYGIISKGIHELSENECLVYFDVMRNGIELILDDILEEKRKEEKRKATIASVAKIKGKIVGIE